MTDAEAVTAVENAWRLAKFVNRYKVVIEVFMVGEDASFRCL
jgi:phosphoribosylamine-glycine ligase